jgi:hypothetical protein
LVDSNHLLIREVRRIRVGQTSPYLRKLVRQVVACHWHLVKAVLWTSLPVKLVAKAFRLVRRGRQFRHRSLRSLVNSNHLLIRDRIGKKKRIGVHRLPPILQVRISCCRPVVIHHR